MSDEIEKEAAPGRSGKKLLLAIVLVVGALAGGGAGAFFAGPKLAELVLGPAEATAAPTPADSADAHALEEDFGGAHGTGAATYMVENLVLNPAESGGTRFLMVSVSFDVRDAEAVSRLTARDAQVRDALLTVLGHKTVEFLTDISHREELKAEIRATVAGLFPSGTVGGVYFPQFVIQ